MGGSEDVAQACADALLTACAHGLQLAGATPTLEASRNAAVAALDVVIERTMREGAKPQ